MTWLNIHRGVIVRTIYCTLKEIYQIGGRKKSEEACDKGLLCLMNIYSLEDIELLFARNEFQTEFLNGHLPIPECWFNTRSRTRRYPDINDEWESSCRAPPRWYLAFNPRRLILQAKVGGKLFFDHLNRKFLRSSSVPQRIVKWIFGSWYH